MEAVPAFSFVHCMRSRIPVIIQLQIKRHDAGSIGSEHEVGGLSRRYGWSICVAGGS